MATIVSAGRDSMINAWSNSGDCISSQAAHRGTVSFLSESNNMRCLISLGTDNMIKLWDMKRFKCFSEIAPSIAVSSTSASSSSSSGGGGGYSKASVSQYVPGTFTKAVWCGPQSFVTGSSTGVIRLYEGGAGGGFSGGGDSMSSAGVNPSAPLDASPSLPTSTSASVSDWVGRDLSVHTSNQSQVACTDLICAMNVNNSSMSMLASASKSGQIFSWVWG